VGGVGSGRLPSLDTRLTVEDCQPLDIRWLDRENLLNAGRSTVSWLKGDRIVGSIVIEGSARSATLYFRTRYRSDKDWVEQQQRVTFAWTDCSLGGRRIWWQCPVCDRRIAILYILRDTFECRKCLGLQYPSQSENELARVYRRLRKSKALIEDRNFGKPGGMHQKTYEKIRDRIIDDSIRADDLFDHLLQRDMQRSE